MKLPVPTSDSSAALRLIAIGKAYGSTQVLDGFDLSIRAGEVVALMGANGAGKSTLAKIASGEQRFGFGIIAHRLIKRRQTVQAYRCIGMLPAKDLLADLQNLLEQRFRKRTNARARRRSGQLLFA